MSRIDTLFTEIEAAREREYREHLWREKEHLIYMRQIIDRIRDAEQRLNRIKSGIDQR